MRKEPTIVEYDITIDGRIVKGHYQIKEWGFIFPSKYDAEEFIKYHKENNYVMIDELLRNFNH